MKNLSVIFLSAVLFLILSGSSIQKDEEQKSNEIESATPIKRVVQFHLKDITLREKEWLVYDIDGITPNSKVTGEIACMMTADKAVDEGIARVTLNLNDLQVIDASKDSYKYPQNGVLTIDHKDFSGTADANGILKVTFLINTMPFGLERLTFTEASFIRIVYESRM